MSAIRHQRVTIFGADDVTPLVGTVVGGAVTDPTCSTDPAHARPYLIRAYELSGTTVDFINGSSTIGQMNCEIVDKRTLSTDQTTGWFTAILANGSGTPQLGGHRILFEQQDGAGAWYTVMNGVIGDVKLKNDKVTYSLAIRDMRERERGMRLFDTNNGILTAIPLMGCVTGWGRINNSTRYIIQPAVAEPAKFYLEPGTSGRAGVAVFASPVASRNRMIFGDFSTNYLNAVTSFEPYFASPTATIEDALSNAIVRGVEIWWRAAGSGGAYTVLSDIRRVPESVWTAWGCLFQPWMSISKSGIYKADTKQKDQAISMLSPDNPALLPSNGQDIEMLVVLKTVPTEKYPLLLELSFGQLLKNIYDGMYSPSSTMPIKYDTAAMAAMVAGTPVARLRITEPVEDARTWVEDNIYKPLGYAPLLNANGEVKPVKYTLPDATVVLPQLDNTNIIEDNARWLHSVKAAVTKVVFKYKSETLTRDEDGVLSAVERDTEVVTINAAATLFNNQTVEYEPQTVRTLIDSTAANSGSGGNGEWLDDVGGRLARERSADLINRFSHGAQQIKLAGKRSDATVAALVPGDWVLLASSWMPDYSALKRGANRVCQVTSIQDTDPITRAIELLDGGPGLSPVAQPSITSATYNSTTGCVDVVATIGAGVEGRIDIATSPTMPSQTSGLWSYAGRLMQSGTLNIYDIAENTIVWVRIRGEADNRRPSAWTTPTSVAIPIYPRVYNLAIELKDGSDPVVSFEKSTSCGGIRVYYAVFSATDPIPTAYTLLGDFDTTSPLTLTGVRVNQFSRIMVRIIAYQGFSAGSVTGTAGATSQAIAQRVSGSMIVPEVKEVRSQDATLGTLAIQSTYDPQYRITKYEFRTQEGDGGTFSAWAQDSTDPYSVQVPLVEAETSIIEYRITALDMDNVELVVAAGSVGFFKGELAGFAECRARVTSASATEIVVVVDGVAPSGTPTVQLVAITGTAALVSGAAIGVSVASGSSWTFSRGAALGGNGQVQFRASCAGFQSDDDFVEIPEQGRDTVTLAMRARVIATSASTITVRVAVADPYPQGAGSVTITYQDYGTGGVAPASGGTVTPAATITEAAGTYIDYVVTRPEATTGTGRVTFSASASNRVSDSDAVDIPTKEKVPLLVTITQTASTGFSDGGAGVLPTVTLTVKVTDPAGLLTGNVDLAIVHNGISALYNNTLGAAAVTFTATIGTTYTFTATLFKALGGGGFAKFTATKVGGYESYATWWASSAWMDMAADLIITIGNNQSSSDVTAKASLVVNTVENADKMKWIASTSSQPTKASVIASGTVVSVGPPFYVSDLGITLAIGDTVYVTVVLYDYAGVVMDKSFEAKATRTKLSKSKTAIFSPARFQTVYGPPGAFRIVAATGVMYLDARYIDSLGLMASGDIVLSQNVTITGVEAEVWQEGWSSGGSPAAIEVAFNADGTEFARLSSTSGSAAWVTWTASCAQTTTNKKITIDVHMVDLYANSVDKYRIRYASVTYIPTDQQATL